MTLNPTEELPTGAIVSREYDVQLPSGETGAIRLTLSDMQYSTGIVQYARRTGATACGSITMIDIPSATSRPLLWTKTRRGLSIIPNRAEQQFSPQLRSALTYCLIAFFGDVEHIVTNLAATDACEAVNDNE